MPTNDERREVARKLRGAEDANDIGAAVGVYCYSSSLCDGCAVESAKKLADLIEPEPERTCHVESWHYETDGDTTFIECELSCGHEVDCFSMPFFCPYCGAKVVR